jgi:hypothetical protein
MAEASLKLKPTTKTFGERELPFTVGLGKLIEFDSFGMFLPNFILHSSGFDSSVWSETGSFSRLMTGGGLTNLPLFQINFPLLFMHVNFLPDEMEVKPDLEQVPPLFIAATA